MAASPTVLDALIDRIVARGAGGPAESGPAAVLWPDVAREWEHLIPLVARHVPIVTLGGYVPERGTGPAYWIRCIIDGAIEQEQQLQGVPVVYLPGYARTDIRAVEEADDALKPLAELLYRGTTFAHVNGRDWTIAAFLKSATHGLGIDVADDQGTKEALLRARVELAAVAVEELRREAPIKAAFFDELISPDLDRDILRWLNDRQAFEASCNADQLAAFSASFAEQFGVQLAEGEIALAGRLGLGGSRWGKVWERFTEAPTRYPHVEELLAGARPTRVGKASTLFEGAWGRWPQDNSEDEERLRASLLALGGGDPTQTRKAIRDLENAHGGRRAWVWATLGRAPLALAIRHLARLGDATEAVAAPIDSVDAMSAYASDGWHADDAVIKAIGSVRTEADRQAVIAAVRPVYEPWLEETARRFQAAVGDAATGYKSDAVPEWPAGTCVVFFDGLRFDIARRVEDGLRATKRVVDVEPRLTALPTLTSTAKPAVSPVAGVLVPGKYFAPAAKQGGPDVGVVALRTLLGAAGYQVLDIGQIGDPSGHAWSELGDLDEIGHLEPWNLPEQAAREVEKVVERVCALLDAGWKQVVVVTDHGWLYLPGGLPKVDFPISVTKEDRGRKGRTARLADGAQAPGATVPWFWDPSVRMAVAPGIATFVGGAVYEHGGVSPQECVTPVITVRNAVGRAGPVEIGVQWAGLRARVSVSGAGSGAQVDLRRKAGDGATSLIGQPRGLDDDGTASLLVPDEDADGTLAFVVVLDAAGSLLGQSQATVGGA